MKLTEHFITEGIRQLDEFSFADLKKKAGEAVQAAQDSGVLDQVKDTATVAADRATQAIDSYAGEGTTDALKDAASSAASNATDAANKAIDSDLGQMIKSKAGNVGDAVRKKMADRGIETADDFMDAAKAGIANRDNYASQATDAARDFASTVRGSDTVSGALDQAGQAATSAMNSEAGKKAKDAATSAMNSEAGKKAKEAGSNLLGTIRNITNR